MAVVTDFADAAAGALGDFADAGSLGGPGTPRPRNPYLQTRQELAVIVVAEFTREHDYS
jgi:hypothetical protein